MLIYLPFLDKSNDNTKIVSYPIYNDQFLCEITYVEASHAMYVQDVNFTRQLDGLLQELHDVYSKTSKFPIEKQKAIKNEY